MELYKKVFSNLIFANKKQPLQETSNENIIEEKNINTSDIIFSPNDNICKLINIFVDKSKQNTPFCLNPYCNSHHNFKNKIKNEECEIPLLKLSIDVAASKRLKQIFPNSSENAISDLGEQIFIHLTCDKMIAWIMLFPPIGKGEKLTSQQIKTTLNNYGITYGIDEQLLNEIPNMKEKYFRLFIAASGKMPSDGKDGHIIDHYPREIKTNTNIEKFANVNYIILNLVQNIKKGDIICDIIPPTNGIDGITVTGSKINSKDGIGARPPKGRNTALSEDGKHLISTCDGHVEFSGRIFQVKPVLEIKNNVKQSNGVINFLGDIHIYGDVCCGSVIKATGNIQVDGVVEGCSIEAGENIIISSGIQGQDKAIIRAHKSIYSKYLEHCRVYARESVFADCIINCNIYSNENVQVTTGRGAIVGGEIHASKEVVANIIGSKAEKLTSIFLGGLPYDDYERNEIIVDIKNITSKIENLQLQAETVENKNKLSTLHVNLRLSKMKIDKLDKDLDFAISSQSINDNRKLISKIIYPHTVVTIDYKDFHIDKIEENCNICMLNGCICKLQKLVMS